MKLSPDTNPLRRLRQTPWRFQTTFVTPLKNLPLFVESIVSSMPHLEEGTLTVLLILGEPTHLGKLLTKYLIPVPYLKDQPLVACGHEEIADLLAAAFADSTDFLFVPAPKPFIIYADHDEYTTFYANTKSNLNLVSHPLLAKNFRQVEDYERPL